MPGFINHYLFGERTYTGLQDEKLKNLIHNYKQLFNLGTQGPDIFFYYFPSNFSSNKKIGGIMHKSQTNLFFRNFIDLLYQENSLQKKEEGLAYLSGLICHYMLDSSTHPYVYYRTTVEGRSALANSADHVNFESIMDNNMLMLERNLRPSELSAYKIIKTSRNELKHVATLFSEVLKKTYIEATYATPKFVQNAMTSMIRELYLLQDKSGRKRKFVRFLERITVKVPILSGMIPVDTAFESIDSLNLNHATWVNPFAPQESRTDSFVTLFGNASKKASFILDQLYQLCYLTSSKQEYQLHREQLLTQLGFLSYTTGLAVD